MAHFLKKEKLLDGQLTLHMRPTTIKEANFVDVLSMP